MCIGLPMEVIEADGPWALARGRDGETRIDTRLVGALRPGDWVLVFQGAARELIGADRATEIQSALDLLGQAMSGQLPSDPTADPGFVLPSSMAAADLSALTGARRATGD